MTSIILQTLGFLVVAIVVSIGMGWYQANDPVPDDCYDPPHGIKWAAYRKTPPSVGIVVIVLIMFLPTILLAIL